MKDKNGNELQSGNKVWIVDMDKHLWHIQSISEKVNIKNTFNGQEISIDSDKILKHAEGGRA